MATGAATDAVATGVPAAPRGPVRRARLIVTIAVVVTLAVATTVLVQAVALPDRREASVCSIDASSCAPLLQTIAPTPSWALLPIGVDGRLTVRDGGLTGAVEIGVVGYLGADPSDLLPTTTTTGSASVAPSETRSLRLTGVPDGARLVLIRTDGVLEGSGGDSACASGPCEALRVGVRRLFDAPAAAVITRLLDARPSVTVVVARKAGAAVSSALRSRASAPARLTASIRTGLRRLTVDWLLDTGGEQVSSVRIAVRRRGAAQAERTKDAIAASGSLVLIGLDSSKTYVVDVAPVVLAAGKRVAGAAVELIAVPDGAADAAGPTEPSAPAGWTPLIDQDFSTPAPLGSFADVYSGWSWYDGMTETSRETNRPRGQVGVWNSATTMRVADGALDCHLRTIGEQPQVCALTPTPDGDQWHGQLYGRYSVRFRADAVPGYKIAWLLWPDSDDWSQGEIDFPEAPLDGSITGSSHRNDGDPSDFAWFVDTATRMGGWHTATIDWQPGRLTFVLDGESWTTTDAAALPRVPMRWALQAETDIVDTPPASSAQGHILIDWVAAWSRSR